MLLYDIIYTRQSVKDEFLTKVLVQGNRIFVPITKALTFPKMNMEGGASMRQPRQDWAVPSLA